MKMEDDNNKKISFSIMILLMFYLSSASHLPKIYGNTFKLSSFFPGLGSFITCPV